MKSLWVFIAILSLIPTPLSANELTLKVTPEELPRINRLIEALKSRESKIPHVTLNGRVETSAAEDFNSYFSDTTQLNEAASPQPQLNPGHVYRTAQFKFYSTACRTCRVDLLEGPCQCFDGERWQLANSLGPKPTDVRVSTHAAVSPHLYAFGLLGNLWGIGQNNARPLQDRQYSMSEFLSQQLAQNHLSVSNLLTPSESAQPSADDIEVTCFIPGQNPQSNQIHLRTVIRFDASRSFAPVSFLLDHVTVSSTGELSPLSAHSYNGTWQDFTEIRPELWLPGRLEVAQSTALFIPARTQLKPTVRTVNKSLQGETRIYTVNRETYTFQDIAVVDTPPPSICPDYPAGTKVADTDSQLGYELTAPSSPLNNDSRRVTEQLAPPIPQPLVAAQTTTLNQSSIPDDSLTPLFWPTLTAGAILTLLVAFFGYRRNSSQKSKPPGTS